MAQTRGWLCHVCINIQPRDLEFDPSDGCLPLRMRRGCCPMEQREEDAGSRQSRKRGTKGLKENSGMRAMIRSLPNARLGFLRLFQSRQIFLDEVWDILSFRIYLFSRDAHVGRTWELSSLEPMAFYSSEMERVGYCPRQNLVCWDAKWHDSSHEISLWYNSRILGR